MNRLFDILFSIILIFTLFFPLIIIIILIKLDDKGSIFFPSRRMGKNNQVFIMYKFRTMVSDTPQINSNDLKDASRYITNIGKIIRKYSMDEIPQIFNVLKGEMTFVGPRPALENQIDLISMRHENDLTSLTPGITGLAQINGRDNLDLQKKIEFEKIYKKNKSLLYDLKIIAKTFKVVVKSKDIIH